MAGYRGGGAFTWNGKRERVGIRLFLAPDWGRWKLRNPAWTVQTMKILFSILCAGLLMVAGTYGLFAPERMREWDLRSAPVGSGGKVPFVRRYIMSRQYIVQARIGGAICYIMAALILIGLYYHGRLPLRW
jgi:hypothetical protein